MNQELEAQDRLVELALEEGLGELHPPDLACRVMSSSRQRCREALARSNEGARFGDLCGAELTSSGRRWASVAVVLLSVGLVTALFWQSDAWQDRSSAQDTGLRLVIPKNAAAFVALLREVQSAQLHVSPRSYARPSITIASKDAQRIATCIDAGAPRAKLSCPSGPVGDEHEIEFQLGSKRVLRARLHGLSDSTPLQIDLVVADGVTQNMGDKLGDVIRPWVRELKRAAVTSLRGRDQLVRFSRRQDAAKFQSLALEGVKTKDLELLNEFKSLRMLDVTRAHEIEGVGLAKSSIRDQLRTLSVGAKQAGGRGTWLGELRRLDNLRVTSAAWDRVRTSMGWQVTIGRGCAACHPATRIKVDQKSGDFAGLTKTRRIRFLEVLGMKLSPGFCKRIVDLPFLESVILSGSDLSKLDPAIFNRLPALRHLDLQGCRGINTQALVDGLSKLTQLQTLNLRGLDAAAGLALRKALPGCDVRF